MQESLYWSLHTGMGMGCVLAVTAVPAASPAWDTWALPFPAPQAEENEASLSNWVDSWTKQAAGAAPGVPHNVQPYGCSAVTPSGGLRLQHMPLASLSQCAQWCIAGVKHEGK